MRIIIAGSRDFDDYRLLCHTIDPLAAKYGRNGLVILSGGARGADSLGAKWALDNGYSMEVYHADWTKHGRAAGMIRNSEMVDNADGLLAFWDGKSRGTKDCIDKARKRGLKVKVIRFDKGEEQ